MSFIVKQSKRVLRVHAIKDGKPLCGNGKRVRSWQEDMGPANCRACARVRRVREATVGA